MLKYKYDRYFNKNLRSITKASVYKGGTALHIAIHKKYIACCNEDPLHTGDSLNTLASKQQANAFLVCFGVRTTYVCEHIVPLF